MNVIIDTGCANLSSVRFAVQRLGYKVKVSKNADDIFAANKLFLPGVGTAREAMKSLEQRALIDLIKQVDKPLLGICLGMQMLAEFSFEGGAALSHEAIPCLGLIPGSVNKLEHSSILRLPHMGWNQVYSEGEQALFRHIPQGSHFYFVHSYALDVSPSTIARCDYGQSFSAAVHHNNFYGVQFHPERSGAVGAQLLKNFLEM